MIIIFVIFFLLFFVFLGLFLGLFWFWFASIDQIIKIIGIVHRDLKPENILLESPGQNARIKITDFGLSKIVRGKKKFLHSRCGTPAYAAPELIEGRPYGSKVIFIYLHIHT